MYPLVLSLHSWIRWAILALGAVAVVAAFRDGAAGRRRVFAFVVALDLQLIAGLALYFFLSPFTRSPGAGRYFRAEHPALGLLAVLLAHGGNVLLKRGDARRTVGAVLLCAALLLAFLTVPWAARPLFRT